MNPLAKFLPKTHTNISMQTRVSLAHHALCSAIADDMRQDPSVEHYLDLTNILSSVIGGTYVSQRARTNMVFEDHKGDKKVVAQWTYDDQVVMAVEISLITGSQADAYSSLVVGCQSVVIDQEFSPIVSQSVRALIAMTEVMAEDVGGPAFVNDDGHYEAVFSYNRSLNYRVVIKGEQPFRVHIDVD